MGKMLQTVLSEVKRLLPVEREKLIDTLLTSMESEDEERIDEAWASEIERRSAELMEGKVTPVSWSKVKQRALTLTRIRRARN